MASGVMTSGVTTSGLKIGVVVFVDGVSVIGAVLISLVGFFDFETCVFLVVSDLPFCSDFLVSVTLVLGGGVFLVVDLDGDFLASVLEDVDFSTSVLDGDFLVSVLVSFFDSFFLVSFLGSFGSCCLVSGLDWIKKFSSWMF